MKKLILLFALILNFSAFSQELKKDTTNKEIKKSEKVKANTGPRFSFTNSIKIMLVKDLPKCIGVSKKGVKCNLPVVGGFYCNTRMCLGNK
jgi:hypothetical protein